jgi:uncharacterized membrane protein
MTSGNPDDDDPPFFSAVLTPHRSLNAHGFLVLMLLIGGLSFAAGLVFLLAGAWPVLGFLGLDVALIYWAFRVNFRTASAREEVMISGSLLRVRKVSHRGEVAEWTLNPLWVQLDRVNDEDFGLTHLFLVSQGRRLPVAAFLPPSERESFAEALAAALAMARRGPVRTVLE